MLLTYQNNLDYFLKNIDSYELRDKAKILAGSSFNKRRDAFQEHGMWIKRFYKTFCKEVDNLRNGCKKFWLRTLRKEWKKAKEYQHLIDGRIGNHGTSKQFYCSDESTRLRKNELRQQEEYLSYIQILDKETQEYLKDDSGNPITLQQIASKSEQRIIASILNRLNSLQILAEREKQIIKMYTITLIGEFHINPSNGNNTYNGTPPTECKDIIQRDFRLAQKRVQKFLSEEERQFNYVKVFEPHKDGTPHCHLLIVGPAHVHTLFVEKFNKSLFCAKLKENHPSIQTYDKSKGKLSTYMFKYIIKSLKKRNEIQKSIFEEQTLTETPTDDNINRNRVWSNIWSIRLFSFGGKYLSGIGKYNYLRQHTGYREDFHTFAENEKEHCEFITEDYINVYNEPVKRYCGLIWRDKTLMKRRYSLVALIPNDSREYKSKQLPTVKEFKDPIESKKSIQSLNTPSEEQLNFKAQNYDLLLYYHSVIADELQKMFKPIENNEPQYFIKLCNFEQFCFDVYEMAGTGTLKEDAIKSFIYNIKDKDYFKKCLNKFEAKAKFDIILECSINSKMLKDKINKSNYKRY